jgi:hypothetical protein
VTWCEESGVSQPATKNQQPTTKVGLACLQKTPRKMVLLMVEDTMIGDMVRGKRRQPTNNQQPETKAQRPKPLDPLREIPNNGT